MSSPSSDPYRSPAALGFLALGIVLVVVGFFVGRDSAGADEGGEILAAVLLLVGVLSLVTAAVVLGTRLALVEHEQSRTPAP
ncbi:hypothetical protein [Aeromicrobium sp. IC_218]|uniref:hypothetical protein n=1 Tax=Aeromicrobium sp. IC_218 TaxID=2545468 RepID=UPI0013F4344C|nr:hypothetical protein [Aeromicrobium sp. IC_218]